MTLLTSQDKLQYRSMNSLSLASVPEKNVLITIKNLSPKWHLYPIKFYVFANPLGFIFNLCLGTNTFPEMWKILIVTPLYKKGANNDICNYRLAINPLHEYLSFHINRKISIQVYYNQTHNLLRSIFLYPVSFR